MCWSGWSTRDELVISESDLRAYASAYERTGFFTRRQDPASLERFFLCHCINVLAIFDLVE